MLGPEFGTQWLFKKYTVTEYLPLISEEVCLIQTSPCLPSLYKSDCFELCKRSLLSEQCPQLTKLLSVFPGSLDLTVQLLAVLIQRVIVQTAEFGVMLLLSQLTKAERPFPQFLLKRIIWHLSNQQKQSRTISINRPIRENRHYRCMSTMTVWELSIVNFLANADSICSPVCDCFQLPASPSICMVHFTFQKKFLTLFLF